MTEAGWTSNVPANEGEYWFRSGGVRKPIVAHVYLDVEQDLRIIIGINDLYVTDLDGFDEFDGAEFLGPLSPDSYQQGRVAGLREAVPLACKYCNDRTKWTPMSNSGYHVCNMPEPGFVRCQAIKIHAALAQQAQEGGVDAGN